MVSLRRQPQKINIVRYADDFTITGKTNKILDTVVRPSVENFLLERGLTLSVEKTRITHIDDGFDFLGWNFRKYSGKLLIKLGAGNMKRFCQNCVAGGGGISSACCFERHFLSHGAPDFPVALAMGQKATPKQSGNMDKTKIFPCGGQQKLGIYSES